MGQAGAKDPPMLRDIERAPRLERCREGVEAEGEERKEEKAEVVRGPDRAGEAEEEIGEEDT